MNHMPSHRFMVLALVAVLFSADSYGNDVGGLFPGFADAHTAALWLFDEPLDPPPVPMRNVTRWYYTQTLTDASVNHSDLHRLNGGRIEPGRFGHALRIDPARIGSGMNLAANYASEPRSYGVHLPADREFVPGTPAAG